MSSKGTKEEYLEATRDLAKEVEEGLSDVPINRQTGNPIRGTRTCVLLKGREFPWRTKEGVQDTQDKA